MSGHYPLYFKFQNCDHLSDSTGLHYYQSLAPIVCSEYSRRLTRERAQGCRVGVVGCRVLCNFFCLGFQKGSGYLSSLCLVGSLLVNFCKKRYTFFFLFFFFLTKPCVSLNTKVFHVIPRHTLHYLHFQENPRYSNLSKAK